jgi:hypothetical protein
MTRHIYVLALILPLALVSSSLAGSLFGKSGKNNPPERVPQLLADLKNDDERKRETAVKELRQFDAAAFPAIVPALVEVLEKDAKVSVRIEAADSLAKLRPASPPVALALEQAMARDPSLRVRLHARRLLMQYRLSGYSSKEKPEEIRAKPVVAEPGSVPHKKAPPSPGKHPLIPPETPPPPLADPEPTPFPLRPLPPPVKTTDGPEL